MRHRSSALLDAYRLQQLRAHTALGDSYFNVEKYDAAIQAYRSVADIFPVSCPFAPDVR